MMKQTEKDKPAYPKRGFRALIPGEATYKGYKLRVARTMVYVDLAHYGWVRIDSIKSPLRDKIHEVMLHLFPPEPQAKAVPQDHVSNEE